MEKQELIKILQSFDYITYDNGKYFDNFHLGQIIAHCIENELKSAGSYQELNFLLENSLSRTGSQNLLNLYDQDYFTEYNVLINSHPTIKEQFKEMLIINELKSLLSLINLELTEVINKKEKLIKTYNRNLLTEITTRSSKLNNLIKFEDALEYINERIINVLDFNSLTAHELTLFELNKADKQILIKQVSDSLSYYLSRNI